MTAKIYPVQKTLRLTEDEAARLKENAAKMQMKEAEYIRLLLNNRPEAYPEIRMLIKTLINEVNHIGVNINQITRNNNSGYFSETDKQRLVAYMQKLNITVEEVVKALGNH